jgi:hypothetical protein
VVGLNRDSNVYQRLARRRISGRYRLFYFMVQEHDLSDDPSGLLSAWSVPLCALQNLPLPIVLRSHVLCFDLNRSKDSRSGTHRKSRDGGLTHPLLLCRSASSECRSWYSAPSRFDRERLEVEDGERVYVQIDHEVGRTYGTHRKNVGRFGHSHV